MGGVQFLVDVVEVKQDIECNENKPRGPEQQW